MSFDAHVTVLHRREHVAIRKSRVGMNHVAIRNLGGARGKSRLRRIREIDEVSPVRAVVVREEHSIFRELELGMMRSISRGIDSQCVDDCAIPRALRIDIDDDEAVHAFRRLIACAGPDVEISRRRRLCLPRNRGDH